MDYEFKRDLYGHYQAEFSMGHEALGRWLTEEIDNNQIKINALLNKLKGLQQQLCLEHQLLGREFMLEMNQDGIEIRAIQLDEASDNSSDYLNDNASEELSPYDQESYACCGLDDFQQLLVAWQRFTSGN